MLEYADTDNRCRSLILLEYFGEESDRCGICDVCRERNELDLSKYEFDLILDEIKSVLSEKNTHSQELVNMIGYPEDKVIKVLRWLLDHKKIIKDKEDQLEWRERDLFS